MKRAMLSAVLALLPIVVLAQNDAPELIIHHARVYTADPAHRWAEAMAIRGNRIVAIGTNADIAALGDAKTHRVDAAGHIVVPGFNDAHTHQGPLPEGQRLKLDDDATWPLVSAGLGNAGEETAGDAWIYGTIGPKVLADPAVTAQALDKASARHKVILTSFTGHGVILSTEAMNALRIKETATDPIGGWYERDANHHLTGKMFEYAGWNADRRLADSASDDEAGAALKTYSDEALQYGITSIQNMSMLSLARYEKVARHFPAPIRIRMIRFPMTENGRVTEGTNLPPTDHERPLAIISGTKWILDGTPIERGAAIRRPYPGTTDATGRLDFTPEEMKAIAKEAFDSKEQTLLHVAGDRTAAAVFDAMRAAGPAEEWRKKRLRIEHGDGLQPDLIPIAKDLGVIVVINPTHVFARGLYPPGGYLPMKSLVKAGIPIGIGSDGEMSPGLNLQLATTGDEALTREEAFDAYTRGSAYAELAENDKGTIAVGKLADLAVLSQDIFKVAADKLPETVSLLTVVDGKIAYDAGALSIAGPLKYKLPLPQ